MDQPSNGLNAAYDLACRYNSLFQYNPSAVYGLFNASKANTHSNQTTSIQKPTSSPTSSLSSLSSSSSSLNNNTQSNQLNNANNSNSNNELSPKSTSTGSDSAFKSSSKTESNGNESANQINEEEEFDDVTTNTDIKLDEESEQVEKETPTNGEAKTKLNEKQRKPTNSYESVSDSGSISDHIESSSSRNESPISSPLNNEQEMEKDAAYHEADVKEELYQANEETKALNRSLSASSSLASSRSSLLSDANPKQDELNGDEEVDDTESVYSKSSFDKMQQSMSLNAKKALASYFEGSSGEVKKRAGGESDEENGSADEDCENPAKKLCVEHKTDSAINKIANNLQLKLNSSNNKSVELNQSDLIRLKEELLVAVGQAIQSTLDSFYDSRGAIKSAKIEISPNQCFNKPNSSANNSLNENLKKLKQQQQPTQHHHKSKIRIHEKSNRSFKPFHSSGSNSLKVMDKTNGKIYDLKDKRNANNNNNSTQLKVNKTTGETNSKPAQPHNNHHHLPLHTSHSTGSLLASNESQISAFSSTNKSLLTAAAAAANSVSSASSPNSNPSLLKTQNPISSAVNQFYTAAMNHLQQQNNSNSSNSSSSAMQSSTPNHPNFNYNHLASNGASPAGPFPFHTGANPAAQFGNGLLNPAISSTNGQQSSLAGPSGLFGQSPSAVAAAHHQFLLSAAAAAAAANANQNTNYLHMAAAANRLFTPYLLDHHQSSSSSLNNSKSLAGAGLQSSVGSMSKPNASSSSSSSSSVSSSTHHHHHNPHFSAAGLGSSLFHTPTKRRRTKVTDTRLSPRNPTLRTGGVLGMSNLVYSSGIGMGASSKAELSADAKSRDHSPSQSCNDNDDQENFNQDYEGNEYQDEERGNQDDETVSSNGNDSSNNGGQLATMPNGYPNGGSLFGVNDLGQNSSLNNDMGSTSNEYVGYQISFLNRKFILNYF